MHIRIRFIFFLLSSVLSLNSLLAEEQLTKAVDNKIYAQTLVNQLMVANPDLYIVGFHAIVPGAKQQTMIACNLDRIGKLDHPDDVEVVVEHKTSLAQKVDEPNKFVVMTPLKDAANHVIGAVVFIYNRFKAGETEEQYYLRSMQLRDEIATKIPNQEALFRPAS